MKLLVVVDMQNDFINGTLGTEEAVNVLPKVKDKILVHRQQGLPVVFTRDTHLTDYLTTQEGNKLPVPHCIQNTRGWEISSELVVADSMIFNKPSFGSLELAEYIKVQYPDADIELVGICTDICVISNAIILKANLPETRITVDASCCAGVTPASHKNALEAMKMCQISIINE